MGMGGHDARARTRHEFVGMHCFGGLGTSKAPVLRENNNNVNFSIDVLYFVPENLKKVQESC
jgi:hypothetical protein